LVFFRRNRSLKKTKNLILASLWVGRARKLRAWFFSPLAQSKKTKNFFLASLWVGKGRKLRVWFFPAASGGKKPKISLLPPEGRDGAREWLKEIANA